MTNSTVLRCDGCGQIASAEHISRRLQRLEWATRYRPIHIGTLFLGGVAPVNDSEFLYAPSAAFAGEAALVLHVAGIATAGKAAETALANFQRGGFFLAHLAECPLNGGIADLQDLVAQRVKSVIARIRRSLKPKRVVPISRELQPIMPSLSSSDLGCAILLDDGKPFDLTSHAAVRLRDRLTIATAAHS